MESWESLQAQLLGAAQGSKIVLANRDDFVAKTMGAVCTHCLGEFIPQHCWTLFKKIVFQDIDSNSHLELEPIG